MIDKTEGIVVNYIKYSESSIIVRIFTRDIGYQSFMVSGTRNKKSRMGIALFQPFSHLELVYYHKPNRELHRLNDAKIITPNSGLLADPSKKTITLFLCEILGKVLYHDHSENHALFSFISDSVRSLNDQKDDFQSFHLFFLLQLTHFLGIGTDESFISSKHTFVTAGGQKLLKSLIDMSEYEAVPSSGEIRFECLEYLMAYYSEHIDQLGEIKSLKVLQQVFH